MHIQHIRSLVSILLLVVPTISTYVLNGELNTDLKSYKAPSKTFDIEGFLNSYGYPFENHDVTTEDGYILGVHRIPNGKNESSVPKEEQRKPAVLIMHGILSNSVDFCILGPNQSLAMFLADLGYDVWLGNNRGNTWSRRHVSLDPDVDASFWDFSFHEHGFYDTAAMIDYILNITGNKKMFYIGHSQGTTQFFALTSTRPEYNDKIALMSALAPVVFMDHMANPIFQTIKNYADVLDMLVDYYNITEFLPHLPEFTPIFQALCNEESEVQEICLAALFAICGFDGDGIDRSTYSLIFENLPAGGSVKQLKHYLQELNSGHFRQFDYGEDKNLEVYGNAVPPDYDLTAVKAPIALYYTENDWIVSLTDVKRLTDLLPNLAKDHLIEYERFNHIDFLFGKDAISLCYQDVANEMQNYVLLESLTSF